MAPFSYAAPAFDTPSQHIPTPISRSVDNPIPPPGGILNNSLFLARASAERWMETGCGRTVPAITSHANQLPYPPFLAANIRDSQKGAAEGATSRRKYQDGRVPADHPSAVPIHMDSAPPTLISPITLGSSVTVICLGRLVGKWPIGFKSLRYAPSYAVPDSFCEYSCEILEGPIFRVVAGDCGVTAESESATDAWIAVAQLASGDRQCDPTPPVMWGASLFGYGHPTVLKLLGCDLN